MALVFMLALAGLVGVSLAIAAGGERWPLLGRLAVHSGLFISLVCLLGLATLLLPSPGSWLMTTAGVAALTVIVTRQSSQVALLGFFLLAVCAGAFFSFSFTAFEVAMSTRVLGTDRDFMTAVIERSATAESLEFLLSVQISLCCGVGVGRLLCSILRGRRQC
jgi:hypothetical protein